MKSIKNMLILYVLLLVILPISVQSQDHKDIRTIRTILPFSDIEEEVVVEVINGYAIYLGDIIIGKIDELENRGAPTTNPSRIWPNSTIPYSFDPAFSSSQVQELTNAINTLAASTNLCLVPRTTESNYVSIIYDTTIGGGWSWIGMVGGGQELHLGTTNATVVIHEFCHAAGLFHEQSRPDRDSYVIINWSNIDPLNMHNFNICSNNGCNSVGAYDFNSIMHYSSYAFSNNNSPTIVKYDGSLIPWNANLTSGDIASINYLYPAECSSNNCPSSQNFTTNISSGTFDYEVSGYITASNIISGTANVTYDAAGYVLMNPGFQAQYGTNFKAIIDGCGGQYFGGGGNDNGSSESQQIESQQEMNLAIFPNPASGVVHFSFNSSSSKDYVIRIFDMAGKLIDTIVPNTGNQGYMELDYETGAFQPGSYIIMLSNEEITESAKLIIIR